VTLPGRRIVIDPGVSLGYVRHGLPPHPVQVAVGRRIRTRIVQSLNTATDVVFSHFHGDHVPLADANPYQLSFLALPALCRELRCWGKSPRDLPADMRERFRDLEALLRTRMRIAEERSEGPLSFSEAVPHGSPERTLGTVVMTRIEMEGGVFVHASDIQLLDDRAVDKVIDWRPNIVLVAGPPLYLERLGKSGRERAWRNAQRLARSIDVLILDHHLMRSEEGAVWLGALSAAVGRKVHSVAAMMGRPARLLEARRVQLYEEMPVREGWHDDYAKGRVDPDRYLEAYSPRRNR
jgi:predicted metallo-beta-lactamase superfamily hydrolase